MAAGVVVCGDGGESGQGRSPVRQVNMTQRIYRHVLQQQNAIQGGPRAGRRRPTLVSGVFLASPRRIGARAVPRESGSGPTPPIADLVVHSIGSLDRGSGPTAAAPT